MKRFGGISAAIAGVLCVAACSSGEAAPEPAPTVTIVETVTATPTPEPTETADDSEADYLASVRFRARTLAPSVANDEQLLNSGEWMCLGARGSEKRDTVRMALKLNGMEAREISAVEYAADKYLC